jgi:hypothetical protein
MIGQKGNLRVQYRVMHPRVAEGVRQRVHDLQSRQIDLTFERSRG